MTVAALFVSPRGPYVGRPCIDAWPAERDARNYRGPYPVVAHPPCERWCRMARAVEARCPGFLVGIDGGCFASALQAVFRFGGVLEHPAFSKAWPEYELQPPSFGRWSECRTEATDRTYWVTEVWQVDYGHRAQKRTWLLYVGRNEPTAMLWRKDRHSAVVSYATNRCRRPLTQRLSSFESSATPPAFVDELIKLARSCGGST